MSLSPTFDWFSWSAWLPLPLYALWFFQAWLTRVRLRDLPELPEAAQAGPLPPTTLCIPARDEEREVGRALDSWLAQDHPDLRIVARAVDPQNEVKLRRAGATAVVAPNALGGMRLASEMLRPRTTTFLDRMLYHGDGDTRMDEAVVPEGSRWNGRFLSEVDVPGATGVVPLAVHLGEDDFLMNPPPQHVVRTGQTLIAIGSVAQIQRLREHLGGEPCAQDARLRATGGVFGDVDAVVQQSRGDGFSLVELPSAEPQGGHSDAQSVRQVVAGVVVFVRAGDGQHARQARIGRDAADEIGAGHVPFQ